MSDKYAPELVVQIKRLQDEVERLKVAESSSFRACEVYHSADQSIPSSVATALAFDTETYDRGGFHDNATNNSRLTVPANEGGIYVCSLNVVFETDAGASLFRFVAIRLNALYDIAADSRLSPTTLTTYVSISAVRLLVAGDYIEAFVAHGSAAARNIESVAGVTPYFSIAQIAKTV